MTRRELIALLGTTAVSWPVGASAQQAERVRRVGVLMPTTEDDTEGRARVAGFMNGLRDVGLSEGRNLKLDIRWGSSDVERLRAFASELVALTPDVLLAGGIIVMSDPFTLVHRTVIVSLAARHRIPTVYPYRYFAADGGLLSYGVDTPDLFRRSASYVDRILNGTKPSDLPVQQPIKFELVLNLKTAKALGLDVPPALLATAIAKNRNRIPARRSERTCRCGCSVCRDIRDSRSSVALLETRRRRQPPSQIATKTASRLARCQFDPPSLGYRSKRIRRLHRRASCLGHNRRAPGRCQKFSLSRCRSPRRAMMK
jgi:hypothetical protein